MASFVDDTTAGRDSEPVGSGRPCLGLVCITSGPAVRFRTITRTRYLAMRTAGRAAALRGLYADNLERLLGALAFCRAQAIHLYRATSSLFPLNDDPLGRDILEEFGGRMAEFGRAADRLGIRVVLHPDQYVVLSSESGDVVSQSVGILERHGRVFDLLGLPRSSWAAMILHGGKSGRGEALIEVVRRLPEPVRSRLVLENDERAYSAEGILAICRRAGVPMVFDAHHHLVKEKLGSYEDASVAEMVGAARETWPVPDWQIVHLSNGREFLADPRHSDLITQVPSAFREVPWIEVEAKGKEEAIAQLRRQWRAAR